MATLLLLHLLVASISSGLCASFRSVPDLEQAMYKDIDGNPCVRLISLSGEIGCGNPGRGKVIAPIRRFTSLGILLTTPTTVLLPYSLFHIFLQKTALEPSFAEHIVGLLVEFDHHRNKSFGNPDKHFPQAEFAPYEAKEYNWNPVGTGVLFERYGFPIFLLSEKETKSLQQVAAENQARNYEHPVHVAEFDFVMQTTKSGTHTSESCLKELTCLPLGGYSVWSALPPLKSSASATKPILLVMASMDSASFFRDVTLGADSSLSGMISLLAAVDALAKVNQSTGFSKQVIFLLSTGEAWGYLGSRSFLRELETGGASIAGLNASQIYQVIEVGSVGQAYIDGSTTFYVHNHERSSGAMEELLQTLQQSANVSANEAMPIQVKMASKNNPGVPPSSLMSFLQKDPSIAGVVIEEFDSSFTNYYFHSHLDDAENINKASITAAASLLARTIFQLAASDTSSDIQSIKANYTLVDELVACLLMADPGMKCAVVSELMTPAQAVPNHYVGVFLGEPTSLPLLENVDDTSRFVWNFLTDRLYSRKLRASSNEKCTTSCTDANEVCLGAKSSQKGTCVQATTRYVPVYSRRLQYDSSGWRLLPFVSNRMLDEIDPVWTESFWKTLGLRVYLQQSSKLDELILVGGCSVILLSFLAVVSTRSLFRKRLKRA